MLKKFTSEWKLVVAVLLIAVFGVWLLQVRQQPQASRASLDAPGLDYLPASSAGPAYVAITWDYSAAPAFNIYRSTSKNGPWTKVNHEPFLQEWHAATDSPIPSGAFTLYYRVVPLNSVGEEQASSPASQVEIENK